MNKFFIFSASILLLFSSTTIFAEIFKWVDERGNVHFTDKPPQDQQTEKVELKINTYSSVEVTPLVERLGKKGKVVMYTTTWCGICKKAKKYFVKNNIPHVTYDVEKSSIGRMDFKSLKGRSVPIIIFGKKRMNGFTVARFERLYAEQKKLEPASESGAEN